MIDGVPAIHLAPEVRSDIPLIISPEERSEFIRTFDALLPRDQAWSSGMMVWGSTRGSDVQLYRDEGGSDEVHFRIDARGFEPELVETICDIARRLDWVLLTQEGAVLLPRTETVLRALIGSSAQRYVDSSRAFVAQASDRIYRPV